jgi:hypothetical protein
MLEYVLNGTCHINIFEVYNFLKLVIERIHAMKHNFINLFIFPHSFDESFMHLISFICMLFS